MGRTDIRPPSSGASAGVSSFNGRTGAVLPTAGDYTAAEVGALSTAGGTVTGPIIPSVSTVNAPGATPTLDLTTTSVATFTGLATGITGWTIVGSPQDGQVLIIRLTDNGTAQSIAWGTEFAASTVALPTTTVAGALLTVSFMYDAASAKFVCGGVA